MNKTTDKFVSLLPKDIDPTLLGLLIDLEKKARVLCHMKDLTGDFEAKDIKAVYEVSKKLKEHIDEKSSTAQPA